MSRSKKGSKSPGYDYWSRRNNGCMTASYGPEIKHQTHKRERAARRRSIERNQKDHGLD